MITPIGSWKQIFSPSGLSKYVNDHTIFADKKGQYRLIGTTSNGNYAPHKERAFVEAISNKIDGPYQEQEIIFKNTPHPGIKIAPFVIFSKQSKKFHLFFGPGKISHYISENGIDWEYHSVAVQTIWPLTRDPHVLVHDNKYLMYLTGSNNRILLYESSDLSEWTFLGTAFQLSFGAPRSLNSACESPVVIKYKNLYYLFTTVTPALIGTKENYNNTLVFRSDNPYNFGIYPKDKLESSSSFFGKIEAHAPEIYVLGTKIVYTTCGWSHMPKPDGISGNGVFMRELKID